ncbi:MAG: hypothetical protein LQ341_005446, partial [Variospora aurantia]
LREAEAPTVVYGSSAGSKSVRRRAQVYISVFPTSYSDNCHGECTLLRRWTRQLIRGTKMRAVTEDDTGLTVLYESPAPSIEYVSSTPFRACYLAVADTFPCDSIIAIHGIGAHPDDTWCKKVDTGSSTERYVNWLSDARMLPAVVPDARIMRYGYQSQWFGDEAISQKVSTVAQRLLLNLRRDRKVRYLFDRDDGLGAMVDAQRSENEWPGIFKCTTGMAFFGTPFRGAGGLDPTVMLQAALSQYAEDQIQGAVLNILAPGNETLIDLLTYFLETRQGEGKAYIACFFEQKSSNVGAILHGSPIQKFVVDETSGCLDQSEWTEKYSLSRDHFGMNKFGRPEEEDFQTVCEVIKKIVEGSPGLISTRNQEGNDFYVQFQLTGLRVAGHFVARDAEMEKIEEHLLPTKAPDRQKIYILHGLGGIGKTQLTIAYARKHQRTYSAIVWVNGRSRDTVVQSLAAFGRRASVAGVSQSTPGMMQQAPDMNAEADAVLRWLGLGKNSRWLMIFDNVDRDVQNDEDGQAYDVTSFLPAADHGSILITTRLPSLGEIGKSIEVTRLGNDQALELLSNRSGLDPSLSDMNKLVQRLGNLPLALVQAGTYMRETKTGCSKYLDLYQKSWTDLVAETPRLRDYENGSIQTTWMISYNRIRHSNPTAAKLLQLWAYLDRQDVWYELFLPGSAACRECEWLQKLTQSEIGFKSVIRSLLAYSLIEAQQHTESYSIHPVVHDWCAETISDGNDDLKTIALTIVGEAVPDDTEAAYWVSQQRLIPHVDRCIRQIGDSDLQSRLGDVKACSIFHELGVLYDDQGKSAEAEKMYQQALDGKEKALGPNDPSLFGTLNNLGNIYTSQGKSAEAEKMYQRALDGFKKWDPNNLFTLEIVNNFGTLYKDQGKHTEAEEMYQRALDGQEKAWGPNHPNTLNTVHNLGTLYYKQGNFTEAEEMYQRALDGKEKALDPNHPSKFDTIYNLGALYYVQGKLTEAEKMLQRALDGSMRVFGPNHPLTLQTINNLRLLTATRSEQIEEIHPRAHDRNDDESATNQTSTIITLDRPG